jgi:hypothetical protein
MSGLRTYRDELYPSVEMDVCEDNVKMFFTFLKNRHDIWHNRFKKILPRDKWTKDPILKETKYTNIYRQLDRGSLWCYYHIIRPSWIFTDKSKDDFKRLMWKLITYRLCVNEQTFELIGLPEYDNYDPHVYYSRIVKHILKPERRFATNAFLTLGGLFKGVNRASGLNYAMMWMHFNLDALIEEINNAEDGYNIISVLCKCPGISGFMAYEVYCDLCYCKDAIKFNINDAVNVGPGAVEGIRLLFPSSDCKKSKVLPLILKLHKEQKYWLDKFNIKIKYTDWLEPVKGELSLRTIEHDLCEFSKYWLQTNKVGKNRLQYDRWKAPANCTVLCNNTKMSGRYLVEDKAVYKNFNKMSKKVMPESKAWKNFKKLSNPTKEDYEKFLRNMQDINKY